MNAPDNLYLPDVQSTADRRNLAIQRVGIRSLLYPVTVATAGAPQPTVATIDMAVALPADRKGTHMSRFIELLAAHPAPLSMKSMRGLLDDMLVRLEATAGSIEMRLPYFVMKSAPVSGAHSLMDYRLTLSIERDDEGVRYRQQVVVPVTSLCPSSKNVADYGAHSQRSHLTLTVEPRAGTELSIDEQIRIAEGAASAELWGLLKRPDEKYVTERAYDNPKFVEDLVRDAALALERDARVLAFRVEAENFESIHNHSAYAVIEHPREHDRRSPR